MRIQATISRIKVKRKRKGVHSKNNTSRNKNSRNYVKKYRAQGR